MVKKVKNPYSPNKEQAVAFAKTGINRWCLKNLAGNWCVHEVMKIYDDCEFPEYHLLVDNFADLEKVEKDLLAIVPAIYMVKPFLTQKLMAGNTQGE